MGPKAFNVFQYFKLSKEDGKKYKTVNEKFVYCFTIRQNTIPEHVKFNSRQQGEIESVDKFIVISIQDSQLSEKIQMEPNLTPERTVTLACQSECVKRQQPTVRRGADVRSTIEAVNGTRQQNRHKRL